MSRNVLLGIVALSATLIVAAAVAVIRWKSEKDARARAAWSDAIRTVVDTTREPGWVETFDAARAQPLTEYDARWRPLFGRLLVDSRLAAVIGDPEGGWQRDGGDDYSFRATDVTTGSVEIVLDGWWDGQGSIGVQGAVQTEQPHRFYEATLWRGKLALIYFTGPAPDQFEVLAESPEPPVRKGFYRVVFRMERSDSSWSLRAMLQDPAKGYAVVARASATDSRLGEGFHGIGLLGGGGPRHSYITGIAARALTKTGSEN